MIEGIPNEYEAAVYSTVGVVSVVSFLGSLIFLPMMVARMPADYFQRPQRPLTTWSRQHPVLRWTALGLKNLLGLALVIGGVLMLVLPGQGLLTIFVGLILLDYPGKHRLERYLIARPSILRAVNWLRRKANSPPLQVDIEHDQPRQAADQHY